MKICLLCVWKGYIYKKNNQLRYDSFSQKYQDTSVQELIAFNGIVFLIVKL